MNQSTLNPAGSATASRSRLLPIVAAVANLAAGILATKLAAVRTGRSGVGIIGFVQPAMNLVALFATLGAGNGLLRECGAGRITPDQTIDGLRTLLLASRRRWSRLGLPFAAVLCVAIATQRSRGIAIGTTSAICVAGALYGWGLVVQQSLAVLVSGRLMHLTAIAAAASTPVAAAAWFVGLRSQSVIGATTTGAALSAAISSLVFARHARGRPAAPIAKRSEFVARVEHFGKQQTVAAVMVLLGALATQFVVARRLGIEPAGVYRAALGPSLALGALYGYIVSSEWLLRSAPGIDGGASAMVGQLVSRSVAAMVVVAIVLVAVRGSVLNLLFSRSFGSGADVAAIASAGLPIYAFGLGLAYLMSRFSNRRYLQTFNVVGLAVQLITLVPFLHRFGLAGAAWSQVAGWTAGTGFVVVSSWLWRESSRLGGRHAALAVGACLLPFLVLGMASGSRHQSSTARSSRSSVEPHTLLARSDACTYESDFFKGDDCVWLVVV
jgi:O-antigen/teichoic acid export membrane protein